MKKMLLSVLIIAVWMILPMTLWANEVTQDEVSNTNTKVFYCWTDWMHSLPGCTDRRIADRLEQ